MKQAIIIFATILMLSCSKTTVTDPTTDNVILTKTGSPQITPCMQALINSAIEKPKGELFTQIDAYRYNSAIVYLYIAGCCDKNNDLKDENCTYLFSHSGGLMGCGDCTHKNFFDEAVYLQTMWKDSRE